MTKLLSTKSKVLWLSKLNILCKIKYDQVSFTSSMI